ncbi:hypothetical protein KIN20_009980 [Parelaphostrongylus tenuis]|uniref:Uncharacterized protein n=1 Tax=Parelaphostrongylus tenuis TaxID=148309 RepID=A0AAD5MBX5_PARTN|nr:hypothetical protein KIN20_009966 [Parelaphostrongylus tenuis]KAJ1353373.1 hypothetical protein KIN20_009980 [Parelaphostrongylus tenuis]
MLSDLKIDTSGEEPFIIPSTLLECDQLCTLIKKDESHIQLSFALYLLPIKRGYLRTREINESKQAQREEQKKVLIRQKGEEENAFRIDDMDRRERYWTLQGQVNTTRADAGGCGVKSTSPSSPSTRIR